MLTTTAKRLAFLLSLSAGFFLVGCSHPAKLQTATRNERTEALHINAEANGRNQIIFLRLNITMVDSTADVYQLKVVNTTLSDGILKKPLQENVTLQPTNLYCEILNGDQKRVAFIPVENPLAKSYEYPNEPGMPMQKMMVKKMSGDFVLRFQLTEECKYLSVYKTDPTNLTLKRLYHATILP